MALMLGIDTGGTFTDAVLVTDDADAVVVAHAKSPTTHHDLTIGVAGAVDQVLRSAGTNVAHQVRLVSVSTTLATNALVEGHGEPAALFTFGFSDRELDRTGLASAVAPAHLVKLGGGHDAHGNEREPLDVEAIERAARERAPEVSAFAVASQFSVRNPAHEIAASRAIRTATGKPVTTSHELSAKLDGPRRALTAALNASLLGTIDRLNHAVVAVLAQHEIEAPLMVVRGDGSLVSAQFASERPIETVLSGPAASVIGALHLARLDSGLVVDIGGTTTDVAVITGGRPRVTDRGAMVGDHRTMVEAVDMATIGLGGDSAVHIDTRHPLGPILLGPERAIPLCRLAVEAPLIHDVLDRQLAAPTGLTTHGRFLVATAPEEVALLDQRERDVLARLASGPLPPAEAAPSGLDQRAAARLQARGLVRVATMTPTDASAVLSDVPGADADAASKAATILARQTGRSGTTVATDGAALSARIVDLLQRRSAEFALRVSLDADGVDHSDRGLLEAAMSNHVGVATVRVAVSAPLTAIGAPAATYYPGVAERAGTTAIIPPHAHVANAVGAVVGRVRIRRTATITQPTRGQFRVHLDDQPTFGSVENARAKATEMLTTAALSDAEAAGAATPELSESWDVRSARVNDKDVFVEGTLTIEASGRPRF